MSVIDFVAGASVAVLVLGVVGARLLRALAYPRAVPPNVPTQIDPGPNFGPIDHRMEDLESVNSYEAWLALFDPCDRPKMDTPQSRRMFAEHLKRC